MILTVVSALMNVILVRAAGLVDQLLQQLLLGMNVPGQRATTISDRPMWSSTSEPVAMPADLAQQMMIFDDLQSLVVVNALRSELYTALKPQDSAAIPNLSEVMAAFELTHTTYFNSPLFRKLIFAALAEQPGLRATSVFAADPDYNRLRQWLKHPEGSVSEDSSGHRLQT